jgi:hypothetical protein
MQHKGFAGLTIQSQFGYSWPNGQPGSPSAASTRTRVRTYGNHNALHISRAVSPENIGSVRVTQGAGSLGSQSSNNLGGPVETFPIDPLDRLTGLANATYGSDETMRGFGAGYPDGLFVAQDGVNPPAAQNFKLVSWDAIMRAIRGESRN